MSFTNGSSLEDVLFDRLGISDNLEKDKFLNPKYELGDVFTFNGIDKAVQRIKQAIDNKEKIGIFADYDCDGIPGAVVLFDLFKMLKAQDSVHVYIPDRHDEGYGLSERGILNLKEKGVSLIITVDLGITAIEGTFFANKEGLDVVITDHHAPLDTYPDAYAVIHPENGDYPNKNLCGAGVAFMLVRAFIQKYGNDFGIKEGAEKWLLDLVAFATLSDMVPLIGENRALVHYGMIVMKKTRRLGLKTLFLKNRIYLNSLTETDLTFTVAPRLNAASRMSTPDLAFRLLSTDDLSEAETISRELEKINTQRKSLVARITKEAYQSVEDRSMPEIVVVGNPEWRPAVLGLVANKLQEKFNKSFFVWGLAGDGSIKGSCRMCSIHNAAKIFQALPEDSILHAGGHKAAGGFSTTKEQIHFLEEKLNKTLGSLEEEKEDLLDLNYVEIGLNDVNTRSLLTVRKFAPFGVGNPEFEFLFKGVQVKSSKMFGKNGEHLECILSDGASTVTAYTFFAEEEMIKNVKADRFMDIVGVIESGFRGGVRIRIRSLDLI